MGWKYHHNIRPGVIFLVSVPTAIRKCRGVWQQWNKKLINLSPTVLNGGTVRPKLWQGYMEKLRYYICSMSYIHFIRTVTEIELSKNIYISLGLRKLLVFIQIIWNKIHVYIHLQYEQWINLFFFFNWMFLPLFAMVMASFCTVDKINQAIDLIWSLKWPLN